ncbi:MAG: hypothetical protein ACK4GO_05670 [Gemmobacter sp.]
MPPLSRSLRYLAMSCALPALMAASPAMADATVGIGFSVSFGSGKVDTGVGLRVLSNNRRNKTVGTVGIDYMFSSQRWRGTVGAAYVGRNAYVGLDLGIGFGDGKIDFGPNVGFTRSKAAPVTTTGDGCDGYDGYDGCGGFDGDDGITLAGDDRLN